MVVTYFSKEKFNKKQYLLALPFFKAVYEPVNIVDLVHGRTDVLKPGVNTVPAPARAASLVESSGSNSSSGSSSSDSSSDETSSRQRTRTRCRRKPLSSAGKEPLKFAFFIM
jgi:hypothetical protein